LAKIPSDMGKKTLEKGVRRAKGEKLLGFFKKIFSKSEMKPMGSDGLLRKKKKG